MIAVGNEVGSCLCTRLPRRLRTHDVLSLQSELARSAKRHAITSVVLSGLGRGSDLSWVSSQRKAKEHFAPLSAVVRAIGDGPVPVVVTLDGHVTGSAIGLGAHARSCIVTERTRMSLPGPMYGIVPESFASYQLARLPRGLGAYLSLTGASLSGAEMVDLGLATHQTESQSLERVDGALG